MALVAKGGGISDEGWWHTTYTSNKGYLHAALVANGGGSRSGSVAALEAKGSVTIEGKMSPAHSRPPRRAPGLHAAFLSGARS